MATPPVKSVVLKTKTPTAAQAILARQQKTAAVNQSLHVWDPHADPIVSAGPVGTGLHLTRSGRYVNGVGAYQGGVTPQQQAATAANRDGTHVPVSKTGLVPSPAGGLNLPAKPLPNASANRPKPKIVIHPDGRVSAATSGQTRTATPQPYTSVGGPSAVPPDARRPGEQALRNLPPTDVITSKPKARVPAASGAAPPYPGLTDEQTAQQQVAATFNPILKSIEDLYARRAAAQQAAINGYTTTLGSLMGSYAPAAGQAYGTASAGLGAINAALAATREGQGAQAQTELAQKLASISADPATAARIQGGLSGDLSGEAVANATRGNVNLASLLSEGAHAADYGAKLPAVAGSMGLRATQQAQGQISRDLETSVSDLVAKRPDAYQTALTNIQGNRLKQQQIDFEQQLAKKEYGLKVKSTHQAQQRLDNDTANTLSNLYGVDANGNLTLAGRKVAALEAKANKKQGALSGSQKASLMARAQKLADTFYYGVPPKYYQGQPVKDTGRDYTPYPTAVNRLVTLGLTVKQATDLLNTYYAPGEGGRPQFTKAQETANAVLFPDPFAALTAGH